MRTTQFQCTCTVSRCQSNSHITLKYSKKEEIIPTDVSTGVSPKHFIFNGTHINTQIIIFDALHAKEESSDYNDHHGVDLDPGVTW